LRGKKKVERKGVDYVPLMQLKVMFHRCACRAILVGSVMVAHSDQTRRRTGIVAGQTYWSIIR